MVNFGKYYNKKIKDKQVNTFYYQWNFCCWTKNEILYHVCALLFYMQCMLYHPFHLDYSHNKDLNKSLLKMTHKKLAENSNNTANFTFSSQSKALGMELQNFQNIIFCDFQFDWTNLPFQCYLVQVL
jgi:hypothetical protein